MYEEAKKAGQAISMVLTVHKGNYIERIKADLVKLQKLKRSFY